MRVLEFVCVYWNLYACIGICMRVLEFVCVYWNLYACIGICMRVLEFVCVFVLMGHRTKVHLFRKYFQIYKQAIEKFPLNFCQPWVELICC